jgi:protease PrsW
MSQPPASAAAVPPALAPAPAPLQVAARNERSSRRVLRVLGILLLALLGLLVLASVGVTAGPMGLLIGLVLAFVPAPLYLFLALRIDRYEPEPLPLLAGAFFWGATAATFIALVLNTAGELAVGASFGSDVGEIYGGSISAPVVEETAKGAVLFAVYRWRRWELNGVLDGIVYATMVGLGFATTENVLYYARAAVEGGVPLAATFFVRGVVSPFGHPLFTALTGIGFGLAVHSAKRSTRFLAPAGGLLAAIALHSLWNTSATVGGGVAFLGVFFLVMIPAFIALVVFAIVAMTREGRLVSQSLAPDVGSGLLSTQDVTVLSSLRNRRQAVREAKRQGKPAEQAREAFHQAATELAFFRDGVGRGVIAPAAAAEGERDHVERVRQLRAAAPSTTAGQLPAPPPGWYADPWRQGRWRWWDGRAWTHHVA